MTDWQRRFPPRKPWPTAVDQLADVDDTAPADGDTFIFDAASGLWKPGPAASPINDASDVPYDPTASGLGATDVQAAIDQVATLITGSWLQIAAWDKAAGDANTNSIIGNVTGYSEALVVFSAVTLTASGWRDVRVSVDGGATFLGGTNYSSMDQNGVVTLESALLSHSTSNASARSGFIRISCLSETMAAKPVDTPARSLPCSMVLTALPITHLQAFPTSGNFSGGRIYIYAR